MAFDLELAGNRVLVTGGTGGTGAAVAEFFAEQGARVMITARKPPEALASAMSFVDADVTTPEG